MDNSRPWYKSQFLIPALIIALAIVGVEIYKAQNQTRSVAEPLSNIITDSNVETASTNTPTTGTSSYARPKNLINSLPITQSATCYFEQVQSAAFENPDDPFADISKREITLKNEKQSKPNIVAFVDLDTQTPKLTANQGQGELIKLVDTPDVVTMIEKTPVVTADNIIVYTIHRNEGVATWSKQYKLISTPFALLSMGYCE